MRLEDLTKEEYNLVESYFMEMSPGYTVGLLWAILERDPKYLDEYFSTPFVDIPKKLPAKLYPARAVYRFRLEVGR